MESNRQRKVAKIIMEDLAELLRKQSSEAGHNIIISVSGVKVSPDLSLAKVYLSIYPDELQKQLMAEVENNKSHYRKYLGNRMAKQVRIIPDLNFYLDTSIQDQERIEKELRGEGDNPIL